MEPNASLSPMPPAQPIHGSPSAGPRKRSIHEVDDAATPSPKPKRTLTEYTAENQENRDPSLPSQSDEVLPPTDNFRNSFQRPTVEIVVRKSSSGQNSPKTASNPELDTPTSKKRKATTATKDAKQQEKDVKERQKQEEKAKKEEEKAKREEEKAKKEEEKRLKAEEKKKRDAERDEEKRKREAEREEEKKQREEKKKAKEDEKAAKEAAKEEEKRKKDEEKEKKARSQMRLNSFFAKPPADSASLGQSKTTVSPGKPLASTDIIHETPPVQKSDYERAFPAFFLQSHTTVAPSHRFERDCGSLEHVRQTIDACLNADTSAQPRPFRPSEVFHMIPFHRKRDRAAASVKDILLQLQKAEEDSTHLPQNQSSGTCTKPEDLLRRVPMKSLKFGEDIRPPYQGTYTRRVSASSAKRLSRNPYYRGLPDTDYDYDSEAEWEEPEEGEELDSEEEEEGSDDGDDDLDGFLDDEDDAPADGKRRLIVGDLEPVCSGIQWAANGVDPELQVYQIQTISDAVKFPIDPFSTAYWEKSKQAPAAKRTAVPGASGRPTGLDVFRVPAVPGGPAGTALPPNSKAKRPFPPEQLGEFKEAVEGNDLSKIGLVEILKKRFPKVSKETLKATLDLVAVRVGEREADKKWVCR
ncbi:uncharacterized protein N7446_009441 [Penicillium canescens]|uniref:Chromatin assembly factor 1 subunit A n=1 Tax=Penicillium canescens TaxID=5083 RepID=A0AAD6N6L2_PENCN|nr:uncharacterized protein N7446_009441 [Penicillium canescens]KAJ6034687.1 hypothetical protein N7460_008862 [Penicillium canescens]KAJ6046349.1 hypothetical protein N7444_007603 [Penicillium canescens]KAJ6053429.1 hypothetical protein N7446_009441 [Penicillium canescens]